MDSFHVQEEEVEEDREELGELVDSEEDHLLESTWPLLPLQPYHNTMLPLVMRVLEEMEPLEVQELLEEAKGQGNCICI